VIAAAVLAALAMATFDSSNDVDYAYAKRCQIHLGATAKLLDRTGIKNPQIGEMSKYYFRIMIEKGLAQGMSLEQIKADHLNTGAEIGARLGNLNESDKAARDREILSTSRECALRVVADGDTK
jgi:hypothetical protein